jgi:uncharacterized protein (TIGR03067 family)
MYHRGSAGSISYAEFRHLGKEGRLGKYSIHFHKVGDSMRGSSVVGASIWDSGNRWVTVHGTDYLVVRDCVGYRSVGHGFFLEDGTETYNVLDRNLAVQAYAGKPLPGQALPFDHNDGAGFWWANSRNAFTRNVAVECDRYGFRFEATAGEGLDLRLPVLHPDGRREPVDIRLLPFLKFEDNEAHDHLLGVNLGGLGGDFFRTGLDGVVPDVGHPFVIRNLRIWNTHWAFAPHTRHAVDGLDIADSTYGLFLPDFDTTGARRARGEAPGDAPAWGRITFRRTDVPIRLPDAISEARHFGDAFDLMEFVRDYQPPSTVITRVTRTAAGALAVRGTSVDEGDGTIARVLVNGREARAVAPGFAEWETTLEGLPAGEVRLSAHAVDDAGNAEPRPHAMLLRWPEGRVLRQAVDEPRKPAADPAARPPVAEAPRAGSDGLRGTWKVVSQQRAGRPVSRPERMRWLIDRDEIWLLIGQAGEQYDARNRPALKSQGQRISLPRGALHMGYRLSPGAAPQQIDLDGPKKASYRGIYRLDGDRLTICLGASRFPSAYGRQAGPEGDSRTGRPAEFSPEAGTLLVLERVED